MIATVEIQGKKYQGEGETTREALNNIRYKGFARLKSMVTVGEKTIVLYPLQTMRLFSPSPLTKEVAVKQTALRFE